jgi:hypothetical protein
MLVNAGADVGSRNNVGWTVLQLVLQSASPHNARANLENIVYILEQGASAYATNYSGRSVSDMAYSDHWSLYPSIGYQGDLWDAALATCGYDLFEFRKDRPRTPIYSQEYTRSHFEALWLGIEHLCPYWDDEPWPATNPHSHLSSKNIYFGCDHSDRALSDTTYEPSEMIDDSVVDRDGEMGRQSLESRAVEEIYFNSNVDSSNEVESSMLGSHSIDNPGNTQSSYQLEGILKNTAVDLCLLPDLNKPVDWTSICPEKSRSMQNMPQLPDFYQGSPWMPEELRNSPSSHGHTYTDLVHQEHTAPQLSGLGEKHHPSPWGAVTERVDRDIWNTLPLDHNPWVDTME